MKEIVVDWVPEEEENGPKGFAYHRQKLQDTYENTGNWTICDMHRAMYKAISRDPVTEYDLEEAKYFIERAYYFAKKMTAKLHQYKQGFNDDWYKKESTKFEEWKRELINGEQNDH